MSSEENQKRMYSKFVEYSAVQYEMHQLYLDGHPIGDVITAEKAVGLYYWLSSALPDLERILRARKAPASRDAARSRPNHHG